MRLNVDALTRMTAQERADALTAGAENQWFERKSIRVSPEVLARAIIGLANAEGGLIAVGVADGRLEDVAKATKHVNTLRQCPRIHCAPPPRVRFTEVEAEHDGEHATILLIDVEPGITMHETSGGEAYLRVGDSTLRLNARQRDELAYDRGAAEYEARAADVSRDDLDPARIAELRAALDTKQSGRHLLAARSLVTSRGEVTIAALLLLGGHPEHFMPHAHVRVLRYLSAGAGTGSRQQVASDGDVRIEGAIPVVLSTSAAQIEEWIPRRQALRPDGRFGSVPVVPRDAWLEGLVNAVVHRSYSMVGDHIRVALFPDRIEIESPGRFPGVVDPDRPLDIARYARNPRIARVCNDLGFTQEKGEGIRRMVDEMRLAGLSDPTFRQTSGSVRVTLLGAPRISPEIEQRLPRGATGALRVLQERGVPLGTGEVSQAIGLQRPATIRALRALRDLGEITWHGTSARDPRATWSLPRGQ